MAGYLAIASRRQRLFFSIVIECERYKVLGLLHRLWLYGHAMAAPRLLPGIKKSIFTLRPKDSIIVVNKGDPRLKVRVRIAQSGRESDGNLSVTEGGQSTFWKRQLGPRRWPQAGFDFYTS